MSVFLSIPQKRTSEVDLVKAIGQQLTTFYGTDQTHNGDIEALNKLRQEATFRGIEGKAQATLTVLQKYYDQLKSFADKCPISDVPINFKWKESFDKGGGISFLGSGSTSQIIQSLAYDRACVLFNIGASYSEIAATTVNEDPSNEHALQLAAKNFQMAAGIFLALKSEVPALLAQRCNHADMNTSVLNIFHEIMLAQAQEAICIKATSGMSDGNISKVASQCSDYYGESLKLIQLVKNIWPAKEWLNHLHAKQLVYNAISDYHQAAVAKNSKKYGEEISWLKHSIELFQAAEAKEPQPEFIQQYARKANRRHVESVKENDFIYHARVPDYSVLDVVDRFSLVKPTPVPAKFAPQFPDLFQSLLPLKVQQGWHKLEARKQEIVSSEIASLQEATANLNAVMSSLNLPASLEDAPGVDLPQSLKAKSKYVQAKGGINHVTKLIGELPELLTRNLEILNDIEKSLRNEEDQDNIQRGKYGKNKWSRKPSSLLNKQWKEYVTKYRETIKNAITADEKVKEKFRNHEGDIRLLSSDNPDAISDNIPTGYRGHNYSNAPCVLKLRQLMIDVDELKKKRQDLESEFKNLDLNEIAKPKFEAASKADAEYNELNLIAEIVSEIFGPLQKKSRESREAQDKLLKEIQIGNDDFVELRGGISSTSMERDKFFSRLAVAHDAFNDLLRHLQEGAKFYNDLTNILVNIQAKVDDFCLSRKIEHDELIRNLGDTPPNLSDLSLTSNTSSGHHASAPPGQSHQPPINYFPPPPLPTMPFSYNGY